MIRLLFKRNLLIILLLAMWGGNLSVGAVSPSAFKIYLNPGHGSWGPNDRPCATIPYPDLASTGRPDTCGFYESNTNLQKVFGAFDDLRSVGVPAANIKLSRWKNGPYPYDGASSGEYNKALTTIAAEVESFAPDYFLSIHSNAATDGTTTNYPLFLYRGTDGSGGDAVTGSRAAALAIWPKHWMNDIDPTSNYSSSSTNVRGDVSFYGSGSNATNSSSGVTYYGYLGALKHGYKGMLAEGFFHTYQPARHRALNFDYCRQEGVRFARGIRSYFSLGAPSTGYIMGTVKDATSPLTNSLYTYKENSVDATAPINGAVVKLYNSGGTLVDTYTTDNNYNGVFVFKNLSPGTYTISVIANGYSDLTNQSVTVTADATTYPKYLMTVGQSSGTGGTSGGSQTVQGTKGIFAYDLRVTQSGGNYTFTYKSNTAATAGTLNFLDATTGSVVGTVSLGAPVEGQNSITIPATDLPGTVGQTLKWSITLEGGYISAVSKINSGTTFDYTRASVVVDNSPESDYFGQFYVFNNVADASTSSAFWAYKQDNNYTRINSSGYKGGQTNFGEVFRLGIDWQGTVYINDWKDNHSGIYLANPANLGGTYSQFFAGTRATSGKFTYNGVATGGSVYSSATAGTGANTKLFVFDEDVSVRDVLVYDIGNSDGTIKSQWTTAPSRIYSTNYATNNSGVSAGLDKNHVTTGHASVWPDSRGGVWICQFRGSGNNNNGAPVLQYLNSSGTLVYVGGTSINSTLNGSQRAGFAVNKENTVLAVADFSGNVVMYTITWSGETPTLTHLRTFAATGIPTTTTVSSNYIYENGIYQMCFDWGGNLYVAGKSIGIYALPTQNNASTVPAKSTLTVTKAAPAGPTADRGIYAYDLYSEDNQDGSYTFSFKPNTNASNAKIVFYDSTSGQELGTYDIGTATKDVEKAVNISLSQIPGQGIINWGVRLTGTAISSVAQLNDVSSGSVFKYSGMSSVVVDNSPESDYFGRFYAFDKSTNGLWAYNQDWSRINSSVYQGGETFGNVMRLGIDCLGTIYVNDWSDPHSGIYLANPSNLGGGFNQFFLGDRDSSTGLITNSGVSVGGSVISSATAGTGANTKLYVYDEDLSPKNILVYNIGQSDGTIASSWSSSPSRTITNTVASYFGDNCQVWPDDRGGVWVSNYRYSSYPCLAYFDDTDSEAFRMSGICRNGGMAVSHDNKYLAIAETDNTIKVYSITWSGKTPSLTLSQTITTSGINTQCYQMAFDWGGNLYVAGYGIAIFALPTSNNTSTVPARSSLYIDKIAYNELTLAEMVDVTQGIAVGDGVELEDNNLLVVYVSDDGRTLYAKDANNYDYGDYPTCGASQIDLLKHSLTGVDADQSNWVAINLPRALTTSDPTYYGHYVTGVKGTVESVVNPEITMLTMPTAGIAQSYTENKYAPCNFLPANWSNSKYFIVQPKPMEYAEVTWAVWNSSSNAFVLPQVTTNGQTVTLDGGFSVNTSMLAGHENASPSSIYTNGQAYKMKAIIKRNESSSNAPRKIDGQGSATISDYYTVYPLSYSANDIVTGIELPVIDVVKTPRAVRYYLPNGIELRDKPESGIFIEVTEYTDGSTSSRKLTR